MEKEYKLIYEVKIPNDGTHDQGYALIFPKEWKKLFTFVNETEYYFQRYYIYSNDFIILEEVKRDFRVLKFNKPFKKENGALVFS